jgi:hypothetical protein
LERTAALVERAYRMALVLKACTLGGHDDAAADGLGGFERIAISSELVELLDEARSTLLVPIGGEQR